MILLQATNETLANASNGINSGMANSFGLALPTMAVVVIAALLVFMGSSIRRIQWVHEALIAFSHTFYYTVLGLVTTLMLILVGLPFYWLSQADGQTRAYVGYAIGGLILAYLLLTGLGYLVDYLVLSTWREYQEQHREAPTDD